MTQPPYSDPPVKTTRTRREVAGASMVLVGLIVVVACSIALGGLLAMGLILGLVVTVVGAFLGSSPTPQDPTVS